MSSLRYDVPYFRNTPDDTHCFQASLRMVLKYFWPNRGFSWDELDAITAKQKDLWTWPMAGLTWLKSNNFDVVDIEDFDYAKFLAAPEEYLTHKFGEDTAREQIIHSNINTELENTRQFLKAVRVENRQPDIQEIRQFLKDGYLVIANVNAEALNDRSGFVGHFVVVIGADDDELILHDPGLPGEENRHVSFGTFMKAWAYPNDGAKNLMAIRFLAAKDAS